MHVDEDFVESVDVSVKRLFDGTVDVCDPLKLFDGGIAPRAAGINHRQK